MKTAVQIYIIILLAGIMHLAFGQPTSAPDDITGKWMNDTGERTIEIYQENGLYFGKVVSTIEGGVPEGTVILKDFQHQKNQSWEGKMYAPKRDQEFDSVISLKDKDTLTIKVSFGFMSKSKEWTRVQ